MTEEEDLVQALIRVEVEDVEAQVTKTKEAIQNQTHDIR